MSRVSRYHLSKPLTDGRILNHGGMRYQLNPDFSDKVGLMSEVRLAGQASASLGNLSDAKRNLSDRLRSRLCLQFR